MDKFSDYPTSLTAPARDAQTVVPNDATDLPVLPRALFVGQTGDVSARLAGGQSVLLQNVQAGSVLPIRTRGVNATGTTAAGIVALW
ncbi:spike base protein, RCAP_Rcc01079 family [Defluviimonas sp. SAOS-178_SWC]|uniref:spike base protein, RCAP_Rcc01079 family n=1 Tax=Defluviimonas sp. SAOS-178_SWC TaxID=3121287 RepID=UPI003221C97D